MVFKWAESMSCQGQERKVESHQYDGDICRKVYGKAEITP